MTKKLPPEVKQSRKPTRVACSFCHSKHLQCDTSRPCKNCIKRGHADTCTDAVRRKKGVPKSKTSSASITTKEKSALKTSIRKPESGVGTPTTALAVATGIPQTDPLSEQRTNDFGIVNLKKDIIASVSAGSGSEVPSITGKATDEKIQKVKSPKKRGRPPKNRTDETPGPKSKQKKPKGKKSQKLNNGDSNVTVGHSTESAIDEHAREGDGETGADEEGSSAKFPSLQKERPNSQIYTTATNHDRPTSAIESNMQSSTDLSGLGVLTPGSSNVLPPPISLLNLANVSLSNVNLQQLNSSSGAALSQNIRPDPSLSDLRLPSFSDLKAPLFSSIQGEIRTPQFDLKMPMQSFSPHLKNNSPSAHTLSMMGLPSLSSSGLQNLLNSNAQAGDMNYPKKPPNKDETFPKTTLNSASPNIDPTNGLQSANMLLNMNGNNHTTEAMTTANLNLDTRVNQNIATASRNNGNNTDNRTDSSNKAPASNGILGMIHDASHTIDPETPGSPLEFSVSSATRTNTVEMNIPTHESIPLSSNHSLNQNLDARFTTQDIVSSNSSMRNFESTMANDEYAQLTDLLNTNPPTPASGYAENKKNRIQIMNQMGSRLKTLRSSNQLSPELENEETFVKGISPTDSDDDDDTRPYIIINLEDASMISSYPNNSTPNSFVYNADHSQMPNTAKEIPKDIEQAENYTSPLIMRHVIKQPDDIYLTSIVKAYQYPKAYHALIAYLKKRFNKRQLLEIAKCMAKYRPSFISATKSLYENDLIFTERSFQRTLLEYENLISMSPSPTIIWRRTGEIVALTNEFAVMTGYSRMSLLSKRTFIVELMDDESTINYFRSFSEFAFGDLNATYLTDCNLRKAEDNNYLRCCCVWTIKRDVFDIPMLIVGQFLPVLE